MLIEGMIDSLRREQKRASVAEIAASQPYTSTRVK